jgi:hypothetical protein
MKPPHRIVILSIAKNLLRQTYRRATNRAYKILRYAQNDNCLFS